MSNEEMNAIISYLAQQGEGVAKTVQEIIDGTGLTRLMVRKRLGSASRDTLPMVEIGKTEDGLDGYVLTDYGLANISDAPAAAPKKKVEPKPVSQPTKEVKKEDSAQSAEEKIVEASDIEYKIASYLVKEGKKKPVFRIAQDISENQDDVERALTRLDAGKFLSSELMTDFNERVYQANEKTKQMANSAPIMLKKETPEAVAPTDLSVIDDFVVSVLSENAEMGGKALSLAVSGKAKGFTPEQVDERIEQLVTESVVFAKPKGRGKTYYMADTSSPVMPTQKAAKKGITPSVEKVSKPDLGTTSPVASGAGKALSSEISGLMDMLDRSMKEDLTSAGPHASDALEKVRDYMSQLEAEVNGWRNLATKFATGAKGILE